MFVLLIKSRDLISESLLVINVWTPGEFVDAAHIDEKLSRRGALNGAGDSPPRLLTTILTSTAISIGK